MFEAHLTQGTLLKKIIEAMREFVTEANFECTPTGITLQAMDSSHVSLVAMELLEGTFEHYRCDRPISLGINIASLSKILKCSGSDDSITIKASEQGDSVTFMFESKNNDRVSDFELKLMDIDGESLGIPDLDYGTEVNLRSAEFQKICKDLSGLGDTMTVSASKEGCQFSVSGDMGTGNIVVRQSSAVDSVKEENGVTIKLEEDVSMAFAVRYLNFFTKATSLSENVSLQMTDGIPLMVEYKINDDIGQGHLRYFLAPKIEDEE